MTQWTGKIAVITGASKGIGRATSLKMAREGITPVIAATSEDLLKTLQEELSSLKSESLMVKCDVTERGDCDHLVKQCMEKFGRVDILVNNAGVGYSGSIMDSDPDEVEQMVKVNIIGVYNMTRAVLPHMIEQKGGDIVNIGSVAGVKYSPNFAIYSATKFAVRAFSEALRNEVQDDRIRVSLIHPGMTKTAFFESFAKKGSPIPLDKGDIMSPEDIADAIFFAVSRRDGIAMNELTLRPSWQER